MAESPSIPWILIALLAGLSSVIFTLALLASVPAT